MLDAAGARALRFAALALLGAGLGFAAAVAADGPDAGTASAAGPDGGNASPATANAAPDSGSALTEAGRVDPLGAAEPPGLQQLRKAFSHKVHAGDNQIGCGVCHPYARRSPNAGLAPASVCMGCHKFVSKEKPTVQALAAEFAAGRPIAWTRQHRVPDHVFFSHERHLAKNVECKACHGDVAAMALDSRVHELQMGFCMDCHRQKLATIDCLACHK